MWRGGVLDSQKRFIPNTFIHYGSGMVYNPDDIKYSNETVIYLGMFYKVWGHCITDNIRRLWFLKSDLYKKYFKGCKLIYIPFQDFDFKTNDRDLKRMLEILDIDVNNFQIAKEVTQYKNIILPDESFFTFTGAVDPRYFTPEYVEMIDQVRNFAVKQSNKFPSSPKKVYFFHGAKEQFGEERLAEYFKSKGYTIIKGHELSSFDEELNILVNCDSFISTIGSSSTNVIFLRDNAEVILIPRAVFINGYQEAANSLHNLNITYVDSSFSIFTDKRYPWVGPFCYILSENLLKYFGDANKSNFKYSESDFRIFINYLKNASTKKMSINPNAMQYYNEIFKNFINQLKQQKYLLKEEGIVIN